MWHLSKGEDEFDFEKSKKWASDKIKLFVGLLF